MQTRVALYKWSEWYRLCHEWLEQRQMCDIVRLRTVNVHRSLRRNRNPIHRQRRWQARVCKGWSQRRRWTADGQVMLGWRYGAWSARLSFCHQQTRTRRCAGKSWPWHASSSRRRKIFRDGDAVESYPLHFLYKCCYGSRCFVTRWRWRRRVAVITHHCCFYKNKTPYLSYCNKKVPTHIVSK